MGENWQKETVPDDAILYMRAHRMYIVGGELQPGVFCDHPKVGGAMSTNWQKYCTSPAQARSMARKPEDVGIISLVAQGVRAVPLGIEHSPDRERNDRSHTDVSGEKTAKARTKLLRIFDWCLKPGE